MLNLETRCNILSLYLKNNKNATQGNDNDFLKKNNSYYNYQLQLEENMQFCILKSLYQQEIHLQKYITNL